MNITSFTTLTLTLFYGPFACANDVQIDLKSAVEYKVKSDTGDKYLKIIHKLIPINFPELNFKGNISFDFIIDNNSKELWVGKPNMLHFIHNGIILGVNSISENVNIKKSVSYINDDLDYIANIMIKDEIEKDVSRRINGKYDRLYNLSYIFGNRIIKQDTAELIPYPITVQNIILSKETIIVQSKSIANNNIEITLNSGLDVIDAKLNSNFFPVLNNGIIGTDYKVWGEPNNVTITSERGPIEVIKCINNNYQTIFIPETRDIWIGPMQAYVLKLDAYIFGIVPERTSNDRVLHIYRGPHARISNNKPQWVEYRATVKNILDDFNNGKMHDKKEIVMPELINNSNSDTIFHISTPIIRESNIIILVEQRQPNGNYEIELDKNMAIISVKKLIQPLPHIELKITR